MEMSVEVWVEVGSMRRVTSTVLDLSWAVMSLDWRFTEHRRRFLSFETNFEESTCFRFPNEPEPREEWSVNLVCRWTLAIQCQPRLNSNLWKMKNDAKSIMNHQSLWAPKRLKIAEGWRQRLFAHIDGLPLWKLQKSLNLFASTKKRLSSTLLTLLASSPPSQNDVKISKHRSMVLMRNSIASPLESVVAARGQRLGSLSHPRLLVNHQKAIRRQTSAKCFDFFPPLWA